MQTGTVEWIGSKTRNTKYGEKEAWSLKIDGVFYNNGFKKPPVDKGQGCKFEFKETSFGKEITSIFPDSAPGAAGPSASAKDPDIYVSRERSIIRQSSLKAAVELLGTGTDPADVIVLARAFESYCTGELDERDFDDTIQG